MLCAYDLICGVILFRVFDISRKLFHHCTFLTLNMTIFVLDDVMFDDVLPFAARLCQFCFKFIMWSWNSDAFDWVEEKIAVFLKSLKAVCCVTAEMRCTWWVDGENCVRDLGGISAHGLSVLVLAITYIRECSAKKRRLLIGRSLRSSLSPNMVRRQVRRRLTIRRWASRMHYSINFE